MAALGANIEMTVRQKLARRFYLDLAGEDTTLISGSGRSGTSWLANICNYRNDFRYMFEPLNPDAHKSNCEVESWCLSESDDSLLVRRMLAGNLRGRWVDSRNQCFFAQRRLIKEIRSNLMLGWMQQHFSVLKIVVIIRNPLMVAASRMRLDKLTDGSQWIWKPSLDRLLKEPHLNALLSSTERALLGQQVGQGVVMETIADWCINNLVARRLPSSSQLTTVYYEAMTAKPEATIKSLFEHINVRYDPIVLDMVRTPSETARVQRNDATDSNRGPDWAKDLSDKDSKLAMELLEAFDINQLYTADWAPVNA